MGGDGRIAEVFSAVHFIEKDLGAIRVTKKFQIFACKAQKDRGAFNIAVLCFFFKVHQKSGKSKPHGTYIITSGYLWLRGRASSE